MHDNQYRHRIQNRKKKYNRNQNHRFKVAMMLYFDGNLLRIRLP